MASKCATCGWRRRSEEKPNSLMSRLWRWHTKWCPAWKAYQKELTEQQAQAQAQPQQAEQAEQAEPAQQQEQPQD